MVLQNGELIGAYWQVSECYVLWVIGEAKRIVTRRDLELVVYGSWQHGSTGHDE